MLPMTPNCTMVLGPAVHHRPGIEQTAVALGEGRAVKMAGRRTPATRPRNERRGGHGRAGVARGEAPSARPSFTSRTARTPRLLLRLEGTPGSSSMPMTSEAGTNSTRPRQGGRPAVEQGLQASGPPDRQDLEIPTRGQGVKKAVNGLLDAQFAGHRIKGNAHALQLLGRG